MKITCYSKLREMLHRQIHAKLNKNIFKKLRRNNMQDSKTFNKVSFDVLRVIKKLCTSGTH